MAKAEIARRALAKIDLSMVGAMACAAAVLLMSWLYLSTLDAAVRPSASVAYEAHEYYLAAALARGLNVYNAAWLQHAPWIANIYTPVYTFSCAMLFKLCGVNIVWARYLTFICLLASVVAFVRIAIVCGSSLLSSITSALFFLSFVPVWFHSTLSKPDYMTLLFDAAGILVLAQGELEGKKNRVWLPAVLCSLAILTKQSSVAVAFGVLCFLLAHKRWRASGMFVLISAVIVLGVSLILQLVTGGFFQQVTFIRSLPFEYPQLELTITSLGFDMVRIAFATFILLIDLLGRMQEKRKLAKAQTPMIPAAGGTMFVSTIFWICIPFALFSMGTPGSSSNQMIFALYFLCLWLAIALRNRIIPTLCALLLSCWTAVESQHFFIAYAAQIADSAKMTSAALASAGEKLLEDPFWYVSKNSPAVIVDCNMFSNYWRVHPEKQVELLQMIDRHRFRQIMINSRDASGQSAQNWTAEVIAAIRKNYRATGAGTGNGVSQTIFTPIGK